MTVRSQTSGPLQQVGHALRAGEWHGTRVVGAWANEIDDPTARCRDAALNLLNGYSGGGRDLILQFARLVTFDEHPATWAKIDAPVRVNEPATRTLGAPGDGKLNDIGKHYGIVW